MLLNSKFQRLTFRRGTVWAARFDLTANRVVYGAAWDGSDFQAFATNSQSTDSASIAPKNSSLLSISKEGKIAILLDRITRDGFIEVGTLATVASDGSAIRICDAVEWADYIPGSDSLMIVRQVRGKERIECPIGKVLFETDGWISHARVSANGGAIAFIHHPVQGDDGGTISVVDLTGKVAELSANWSSARGLVWSRTGTEIWFTAAKEGLARSLQGTSFLSGKLRTILNVPGTLTVHDLAPDGRILLTRDELRSGIRFGVAGKSAERELGWLDWSTVSDISSDGTMILFSESGEGAGPQYKIFVRRTDGSTPTRIGNGTATALSPDGAWVLLPRPPGSPNALSLVSVNGDDQKHFQADIQIRWGCWLPDGKSLLLLGAVGNSIPRMFIFEFNSGNLYPLTEQGVQTEWNTISPDGRSMAVLNDDQAILVLSLVGGGQSVVPATSIGDIPIRWSPYPSKIFVARSGSNHSQIVYLVDVTNGEREVWKTLQPPDTSGVFATTPPRISSSANEYAYTYAVWLSTLYEAMPNCRK